MYQTTCAACGLSVHDLPDEIGDVEIVLDTFFDYADDGSLYCNGCVQRGEGVFL